MAAIFTLEDGSGVADANALVSVAEADQFIENYGDSSNWSGASQAEKEAAIRQATRYLDLNYVWAGYKLYDTQNLQWPRYEMYDEDGNYMDQDAIPEKVKEACADLALKVIEGDTLLLDQDNESKVKRTKDVLGPITEEREYLGGESPEKKYTTADKLLAPFIISDDEFFTTDIERA